MDTNNDQQNLNSGFVNLSNGESLYVHVCGSGKEVLLMLHGLLMDHRCFNALLPYLENKFKIIIPHLRGHGQSTYVTPLESNDDVVNDLALLVKQIGLEKFHVFGWSYGGAIAIKFAANYPEKVGKIVISGPKELENRKIYLITPEGKVPIVSKSEFHKYPRVINAEKLKESKDKNLFREKIRNRMPKNASNEILDLLLDQSLLARNPKDALWMSFTDNLTENTTWGFPGSGEILKMKNELLIIYAHDDVIIPKVVIDQYKDYLGDNLSIKYLPEGGHHVHMFYPKEVSEATIEFLSLI
jgi:pimeloyl-ACP methyl ester carboxylesterase